MKIHISNDLAERKEAAAVIAALRRILPHARVHQKNEDKTGKEHTYLTIRPNEKT